MCATASFYECHCCVLGGGGGGGGAGYKAGREMGTSQTEIPQYAAEKRRGYTVYARRIKH